MTRQHTQSHMFKDHFLQSAVLLLVHVLFFPSQSLWAEEAVLHWTIGGPGAEEFLIEVDSTHAHSGKRSVRISNQASAPTQFVTLMQKIRAYDYRGQQVQLTAWVKTENVANAHIWMRVDSLRRYLALDAMEGRRINGTSDWFSVSLVLNVPEQAEVINIGAVHGSTGILWVDNFQLMVPDEAMESTNSLEREPLFENQTKPRPVDHLPFNLRNGDFEF